MAVFDLANSAQNCIDRFIGYWIDGVKIIFGEDAQPTDKAPIPFYASGTGYYQLQNSPIFNSSDIGGFSYATCAWEVCDSNLKIHCTGIPNSSRPAIWNDSVVAYWEAEPLKSRPNESYISENSIVSYGYHMTNNTAVPTCITGYDAQSNYFKNIIITDWYDSSQNLYRTGNITVIDNGSGVVDPVTYQKVGTVTRPIPDNSTQLHLPLANDAYWFFCGDLSGNSSLNVNFYNSFDSHNTNNSYYEDTTYNQYYNTYNVSVSPDLNFDIGVGPLGVAIGVGGVAGGGITLSPEIDFDDLIDILTPIVNDLNNNSNYDFDIQLHDFDYYMNNYNDYGDFYIEPLHQYDNLPHAQTFDGTVDLGDYPRVIGESVNTYMGLLPAGISVLLSAVFIIAIILDNLRGRR